MNVKLISKYRTQLMGVAIVFVALFHSSIVRANELLDMVCFFGDIGVDIFLFLSGLGMYYAFQKRITLKKFYWKRCVRIIPIWFFINLLLQLDNVGFNIKQLEPVAFIKYLTGFSFWIDGNLYYWYIPVQLAFYIVTPLFMKLYKASVKKAFGTVGIVWIVLLGLSLITYNAKYFIFLFRWPIYFSGIWFGELSVKERKITSKESVLGSIVSFFAIVGLYFVKEYNGSCKFIRYEYKYFLYYIIVIFLCLLLAFLFEKISYNFYILKFLGGITLEIYLLHEFLLRKITENIGSVPFDTYGIIYNILVFIGVSIVAWGGHEVFGWLLSKNKS